MCKKNEREDVIGKKNLKKSGRTGDGLRRGKEERGMEREGREGNTDLRSRRVWK
jgi:hypothetical protein